MILEGIVTTQDENGRPHVAPMGAVVEPACDSPRSLVLRPFRNTRTFANLQRTGRAVFHVTDDVEMLARAAVGRLETEPETVAAPGFAGWILTGACRWYALEIAAVDADEPRANIDARVVAEGRLRDFFGLNRAKHAVVEAAILATRIGLLPLDRIQEDLARLRPLVDKTGGPAERAAFAFLAEYVDRAAGEAT